MAKMHKSYLYLLESSCTEPVLKLKIILLNCVPMTAFNLRELRV